MSIKKLIGSFVGFLLCANAYSVTVSVGPVYLDWVSAVGRPAFNHPAGNIEIQVTGGIPNLNGANCSNLHVTTKGDIPNINQLFAILVAAQAAQKPLYLGITDDAAYTAFGGRCSLVSAALTK